MGDRFYRIARFSLRVAFRLGGGLTVEGRENMPADGPLIVACNHTSYLDPPLLGAGLPRIVCFMARKTLFEHWFGAWVISNLHAFPLDREGDSREALRVFGTHLEAGRAVVLFPEGTRSPTGRLQPLRPGVSLIATRYHAPVLPVYIRGAFESWPRGRSLPCRQHFRMFIGEPIVPGAGESREERKAAQRQLSHALETALHALEARAYADEG